MQVADIEANDLMSVIKEYTSFLKKCEKITQFEIADLQFTVNTRVKNDNSIEEKYEDYLRRNEQGKVSINKCYNDLFGVRAIVDCQDLSYEIIEKGLSREGISIEKKDDRHKSRPLSYKATHIYFKTDNKSFRWELQIWRSLDEKDNQRSHEHHRFRYREWESQTKKQLVKDEVER
jgi:hypothetical protein